MDDRNGKITILTPPVQSDSGAGITGRLSSSAPNLQNFPRSARSIYCEVGMSINTCKLFNGMSLFGYLVNIRYTCKALGKDVTKFYMKEEYQEQFKHHRNYPYKDSSDRGSPG